jgi:hypothetical protein
MHVLPEVQGQCCFQESTCLSNVSLNVPKTLGAEQGRLWLKASAYGLYELLVNCQDVGNESDPGQLAQLTSLMALVAPGSESHLFLTLERLLRAGQIAKASSETEQAAKECVLVSGD